MLRFSIRKLMRAIALFAVAFSIHVFLSRRAEEVVAHKYRVQCANHVKSLVLAIVDRENHVKTFPAGTWPNPNLVPNDRLSWYAEILPYLEYDLLNSLDRTQPWGVGINHSITCTLLYVFRYMYTYGAPRGPAANYIGIAGLGMDAPLLPKGDPRAGVFGYDRQTTIADIKDGLGSTMLVAETGRVSGSWLAGGPATVRGLNPEEQPYLGPGRQFGGRHRGGATIGLADGSVRFVSESIDPKVFGALSTIAGGERILYRDLE